MIAIQTKYLPATDHKGARIKASTDTGFNATVPLNYALSGEKLHFEAVKELVKKYKLDWNIKNMVYGGLKNGYVFCFSDSTIEGSV